MNDAERDAWLREALRHAPDSDALPPSGVSEAILLKARAAARATPPPTRRAGSGDAHANPLTALWNWLARPPVAAGFASVMAVTLVGLMWWDRPMDEGMPRPPALASERAPASTSPALAAAPPATIADATPSRPDARTMSEANVATDDSALGRRKRSAPEPPGAANAELADRGAAARAKRSIDMLAKEQARPSEEKSEAPAPFPSAEVQRETPSPRQSLDKAVANDASKKDVDAGRSRAADQLERAAAPATARPVAPPAVAQPPPMGAAAPAPQAPQAPQAPLASGRLAADERRPAAPVESPVAAKEKSVAATPAASPTPADAPRLQQPQSAFGGMREQGAAGLASSPPVPSGPASLRGESQRRGSDVPLRPDALAVAAAPARVLAAIAAEPGRWSRRTASGDSIALDAGWRAWLAELDAAAAGRWQPLGAAVPVADGAAARDGSTTLRLVNAGRIVAIVRLDGARVQVDAVPGTGDDRWQATLVPADAEQLRTSARRLSP